MECLKISKKCVFNVLLCGCTVVPFTYWMLGVSLSSSRNAVTAERWKYFTENRPIISQLKQSRSDRSSHWKIKELQTLEKLVQRRLSYLQNPKNCEAARKVLCRLPKHGFGCVLHQLTFCLIVAYATERTLILESKGWRYAKEGWETMFLPLSTNCTSTMNHTVSVTKDLRNIAHIKVIALPKMQGLSYMPTYLPLAIPDDLADKLIHVHRNPSLWWIGQFVTYLIRPNQDMQYYLKQSQEALGFKRPIVGMHIRRTDKKSEAEYHQLEEYMQHVHKWFNQHEKNVSQSRYVYLATDDPNVLKEARNKYLNYKFINVNTYMAAKRYTETSLRGFLVDVHILSMCDFVVCTMSSNVGRLLFELMQSRDGEASNRLISLDTDYYFDHNLFSKRIVQQFKQNGSSGLQMKGYSVVNDRRSNTLKPIFTRDNKMLRVAMPVYSEVK